MKKNTFNYPTQWKFAPNLSLLYPEVPFLERFARAAQAGFSAVEFHFPYEQDVEELRSCLEALALTQALFNLPPGEVTAGEWGTLSNPRRREYFQESFLLALDWARHLGCRRLNMMFGQRVQEISWDDQLDCACENLGWAAHLAAEDGLLLLIEPLNPQDFPGYGLVDLSAAVEVIRRVSHPLVQLLFDVYHVQMATQEAVNLLVDCLPVTGHIQIADAPGRHQPGTGRINFAEVFRLLRDGSYSGFIGLEYHPLGETDASLDWLADIASSG